MCLFDEVLLSVLWVVFGEYCACVYVKVSLSVLWRVFGEYWMCVFDKVSLNVLWYSVSIGFAFLVGFP